jgi:Vacuole effluxer Atg22 like
VSAQPALNGIMGETREPNLISADVVAADGTEGIEKQAAYPGEDTSFTSKRELRGWYVLSGDVANHRYMYAWATEVFATICAAIFFPVNLEQLARENGVYAFDRLTPCTQPLPNITDPSLFTTFVLQPIAEDRSRCVIHFLGLTWMDSSSFALYTFSISTFLQTILVVSMSGAADYGIPRIIHTKPRQLSENLLNIILGNLSRWDGWFWSGRDHRTASLPPRESLRNLFECTHKRFRF